MCCFVVPMAQAIATTVYRKVCGSRIDSGNVFMRNIPALEKMLWGGTVMLIVDHIISGELSWQFPFFTALNAANGWSVLLEEMLGTGVPMSVVLTVVWMAYSVIVERRKSASAL